MILNEAFPESLHRNGSKEGITNPICFNNVWVERVLDIVFVCNKAKIYVECVKILHERNQLVTANIFLFVGDNCLCFIRTTVLE